MKLIYKGKFNGDTKSLPHAEHMPNAVCFKEFDSMKRLAIVLNIASVFLMLPLLAGVYLRGGFLALVNIFGLLMPTLMLFPHEILHALCFKEEVYLYTNFKQGMLFVIGTETMSKGRFIFMSLLPNIIFGFIPYILFMLFPQITFLGVFGALSIGAGIGDYYNVWNAVRQMPKGARTYMYEHHSYWYMPDSGNQDEIQN